MTTKLQRLDNANATFIFESSEKEKPPSLLYKASTI